MGTLQSEGEVPETHVLAIASHVTAGYVGNTMATFCMQILGCEVSAIHTVNYSNHLAYKTATGRKTPASEVAELYAGLKTAHLEDFDVLLSGYCPGKEVVVEVGRIGREARARSSSSGSSTRSSFFWILDPVMGDNGRLYVAEDCVPAYKELLSQGPPDLILPNQFEAELLSGVKISDWNSLRGAIEALHALYGLPHVLITSVRFPGEEEKGLSIIGSSTTSTGVARVWRIQVPALPVFFSGTGDMFAALLVARLRQAVQNAGIEKVEGWKSPDEVKAEELPLAKAAELVLASMHSVLKDTEGVYEVAKKEVREGESEEDRYLRLTRAAEVRVVRNWEELKRPRLSEGFKAVAME